jgi:hypothetical protein
MLPKEGLKVAPGSKSPLAGPLGIGIHEGVKNLQTMMAHAERISIREGKAQLAPHLAVILYNAVELTTHVLARHLNAGHDL